MKWMQLSMLFVLAQCSLAQQPKVALLPGSAFSSDQRVNYDNVERSVSLQQKDLRVEFADGKTGYFRVYAIYDNQDHLFWWISFPGRSAPSPSDTRDQTALFFEDHLLRFAAGKIIVFWPGPSSVKILSSADACSSDQQCWDGIYRALDEGLLGDYFQISRGIVTIELEQLLGKEFVERKEDRFSAAPKMYVPKIDSIEAEAGDWVIRFEGANGNHGVVVLNDKLQVKSSQVAK
jgi:hypothetical protein